MITEMKQEILCKECALKIRERFPTNNPFPGEHIMFVKGVAKTDMKCDGCHELKELKTGEEVYAFSLWTDYEGIPYYPWENKYITLLPNGHPLENVPDSVKRV
jgi:hypothetical protein